MTASPQSGPGLGLQLPQYLYPTELNNAPYDASTNRVALAPGQALPIPRGDWLVSPGIYCVIQFLDPVTNTWVLSTSAAWNHGSIFVSSDGFSVRVANLLGCPITANVAAPGSGYVQASTTVVPTPGNSTWVPIVGGALVTTAATIVTSQAGAGYGVAPIVLIPPPPGPAQNANGVGGIQASAYCAIANGTVSGFTFTNPGAGYPSAPACVILPNPTDPNIATGITQATVGLTITQAGSITGALCTNPGAPLSNPNQITLTLAGAGSSGSLAANVLQTVTAASVAGVGTGYGTVSALLTTVGGVPAVGSIAQNESGLGLAWRPRPAQIGLTITNAGTIGTQVGTIYDGGMFLNSAATGVPNYVIAGQPQTATTVAIVAPTLTLTMGSRPDVVTLQPLKV